MSYNPLIHHRRSIRMKGYDYSQEGLYFITICVYDMACLFGKIENGEMQLNEMGQIAHNEWIRTSELRKNVELDVFIIMPNHIHGILILNRTGELHSPYCNSQNTDFGVLHSPNNNTQNTFFSELHSLHNDTAHTKFGISHSPQNIPSEPISDEMNAGECKSVIHISTEKNLSETNSTEINSVEFNRGECNSPLRGPSNNIGAIVRGYKSSVTKQLNVLNVGRTVWQRNYWEHIIRDDASYQRISDYIMNNPVKWENDKFYTQ